MPRIIRLLRPLTGRTTPDIGPCPAVLARAGAWPGAGLHALGAVVGAAEAVDGSRGQLHQSSVTQVIVICTN